MGFKSFWSSGQKILTKLTIPTKLQQPLIVVGGSSFWIASIQLLKGLMHTLLFLMKIVLPMYWRSLWSLLILKRVHHFSTAWLGEMMSHVYLWELQSGPSCVASSTHSMLGWVIPYMIFFVVKSQQRASHYIALFD